MRAHFVTLRMSILRTHFLAWLVSIGCYLALTKNLGQKFDGLLALLASDNLQMVVAYLPSPQNIRPSDLAPFIPSQIRVTRDEYVYVREVSLFDIRRPPLLFSILWTSLRPIFQILLQHD